MDLSNYNMHVHRNDKDMFKKIELHVVSDKCVSSITYYKSLKSSSIKFLYVRGV